jgi:hypothetical protein
MEWRYTMGNYIMEGKWEQLVPRPPCGSARCIPCIMIGFTARLTLRSLIVLLEKSHLFTEQTHQTLQQIYSQICPSEWVEALIKASSPLPALRYLVSHHFLPLDVSHPRTLIGVGISHLSQEIIEFLLSPQVGVSIHLPDSRGYTPLHTLLELISDNRLNTTIHENPAYSLLPFILERGANPLLPDASGENAFIYATRIHPHDIRKAVIDLLQSYVF